jgi:hypothetical protein
MAVPDVVGFGAVVAGAELMVPATVVLGVEESVVVASPNRDEDDAIGGSILPDMVALISPVTGAFSSSIRTLA